MITTFKILSRHSMQPFYWTFLFYIILGLQKSCKEKTVFLYTFQPAPPIKIIGLNNFVINI